MYDDVFIDVVVRHVAHFAIVILSTSIYQHETLADEHNSQHVVPSPDDSSVRGKDKNVGDTATALPPL
jgi:hypothetical protein